MKINVCGINYKIKKVNELDNDPNCLGLCIYHESLILLKSNLSYERKKQVLVHELLHAMLYESGYTEHDEQLVNNLSICLNQVINHNDLKATLTKLE